MYAFGEANQYQSAMHADDIKFTGSNPDTNLYAYPERNISFLMSSITVYEGHLTWT